MGLIKAILGATGGVLADSWKEFFYCDSLSAEVLVSKGQKRTSTSSRSSNTKGEENIISNGSVIAVADGQFMIIVDQGKIMEFSGQPGEFLYDSSTEPSLFYGNFGENLKSTFNNIGKRFGFGGDTGKDQRVYFFNMKEIMGNKYGTPNAVPFRVVDKNIGMDIDISIRCHGEYSYKIADPLLFYTNVCGNIQNNYTRENIDSQLKSEFMTALQPAFAKISDMGIRYSALPGHTIELSEALNAVLSPKWSSLRGISIASIGVNSVKASEEDEEMMKQLQRTAVMRDPTMAAATLVSAQSDAMVNASKNTSGAMTGFMGMGMAQSNGGINTQNLFEMGNKHKQEFLEKFDNSWNCECGCVASGKFCTECGATKPFPKLQNTWRCKCGVENKGKFCAECGVLKPEINGWACICGTINKGKFCSECGEKKPADEKLYICDKCGWEPEDASNPPKFCPECGDLFNEDDVK